MLANWNNVPPIPAVGASGALFGVMMAAAMIRPNVEMYITYELSVWDDTPIGASALCALGASHCVCPHGKPTRSNLRHSP